MGLLKMAHAQFNPLPHRRTLLILSQNIIRNNLS